MTYTGNGVQVYAQTQVSTTPSQQQLIVMAYDGILRFLDKGLKHLEAREFEAKHEALTRARDIIRELACTLNMEEGGEIARNLWNLYCFFMRKISETNLTNDPSHVTGIVPSIQELRSAWAELEIPEDDARAQAINRRVPAPQETGRLSVTG